MQQDTTPDHRGQHDLQPSQIRALAALAGGASVTQAAEAARVDRTTVHRWLREDFAFQAAFNALTADLRRELSARLEHTVQVAAETVLNAIEGGDVRAAIALLKGSGVLLLGTTGSDDPVEIREEAEIAESERRSLRDRRRLLAL